MQVRAENFTLLKNLVSQAKRVLLLVSNDPSVDTLAAGLFIRDQLVSVGAKVKLIAPGKLPESLQDRRADISDKLPAPKLVVSFNWRENAVDRVSYNLEGENFNFLITPLNKKIDPGQVKVATIGEEADLIITLGIGSIGEYSKLDEELFNQKPLVNFDKSEKNELFGSLNFVQSSADSLCSVVANTFEKASIEVKTDVQLLLLGLRESTENFTSVTDPETFEAAAFCTRVKERKLGRPEASREDWPAADFSVKENPN